MHLLTFTFDSYFFSNITSPSQGEHSWKDVAKSFCSKFSLESATSAPPQYELFPSLPNSSPLGIPSVLSIPSSSPEGSTSSTRFLGHQSISVASSRNDLESPVSRQTFNSSGLELRPPQNSQLRTQLASPISRPKILRRRRRKTSPSSSPLPVSKVSPQSFLVSPSSSKRAAKKESVIPSFPFSGYHFYPFM